MLYIFLYLITIAIGNISVAHFPLVVTSLGIVSLKALVIGTTFVLRDYVQRAIGHNVFWIILMGTVISYMTATPGIAALIAGSFLIFNLMDWLIFSITKRPFHERVWISSLLSAPLDTATVLYFSDIESTVGRIILLLTMKLTAPFIVWMMGYKAELSRK